MSRLRLGTRGSPLARAQSQWTADRLMALHPGLEVELVVIKTSGDRFSLGEKPAAPNLKAQFVKELEDALLEGGIDFAVHSAKDLPGDLPEGLCLAAYPPREDPRDVFVPGSSLSWEDVQDGAVLGTASLRRQVQLRLARPGLKFEVVRGNVDTRLRKLQEKGYAGLVLAAAGLKRLGLDRVPREAFPADLVVPAPGQGALALEARQDRPGTLQLLAALSDEKTRLEVELERALLKALGGGCSTPLGALARADERSVVFRVFWSREDGSRALRLCERSGLRPEDRAALLDGLLRRIDAGR
ncbi:MAG TPA: hydroxymethylbilane synthase [Elusimicrobia bacterium]|nr:hydroxymethylbilane synthase [Elusimicrobiota bacterium]